MFHLKELSREEGLRLVEEAREKAWRDQMARLNDSFNRGFGEGFKQGLKEGWAIKMLKNGLEVSLIPKITGLSTEKINELKKSLS